MAWDQDWWDRYNAEAVRQLRVDNQRIADQWKTWTKTSVGPWIPLPLPPPKEPSGPPRKASPLQKAIYTLLAVTGAIAGSVAAPTIGIGTVWGLVLGALVGWIGVPLAFFGLLLLVGAVVFGLLELVLIVLGFILEVAKVVLVVAVVVGIIWVIVQVQGG